MSSKTDKKKAMVPKLRFPEFRDAGPWEVKRLGEISDRIIEKVGDRELVPVSITAGTGFVSQIEKFGRNISGKQYKNYILLRKGQFSYNKGNSKTFPQGCIYQLREFEEAAVPNAFYSFAFRRDYVPEFYKGYFETNFHGKQLIKYITSSARSDGLLNISPNDFFSIILPTPIDKDEQQKIADCLSSLDELIELQTQKLEALKAHKKGLMQQLFPQEGETTPRLRFPEFRDAGPWEVKRLGEVCDVLDNLRKPITSTKRRPGPYPYYGASGVIDYIDDYIFDERLLLIGEDGAKWGPYEKTAFIVEGKYWVNNHAHVLRPTLVIDTLLENWLTVSDISIYVTGAAPPKLTLDNLKSIRVPIPPNRDEQQKIADCLSSIDEVIELEAKKLDALKAHKKGLMQQLFPQEVG